jgi:hypothetical protein
MKNSLLLLLTNAFIIEFDFVLIILAYALYAGLPEHYFKSILCSSAPIAVIVPLASVIGNERLSPSIEPEPD